MYIEGSYIEAPVPYAYRILLGSGTHISHIHPAGRSTQYAKHSCEFEAMGDPRSTVNSESCVTLDSQVYYRLMYSQGCLMALE